MDVATKPGTKEDVFDLHSGAVVVRWPDTLSEDEYQDVFEWLSIVQRKIKRCVRQPNSGDAPSA